MLPRKRAACPGRRNRWGANLELNVSGSRPATLVLGSPGIICSVNGDAASGPGFRCLKTMTDPGGSNTQSKESSSSGERRASPPGQAYSKHPPVVADDSEL